MDYADILHMCQQSTTPTQPSSNLASAESIAIKQLTDNRQLIIRSADKGGGIVVQNHSDFQLESARLLSDSYMYLKLTSDPLPQFSIEVHNLIDKAAVDGIITTSEVAFLKHEFYKRPYFFIIFLRSTRTSAWEIDRCSNGK